MKIDRYTQNDIKEYVPATWGIFIKYDNIAKGHALELELSEDDDTHYSNLIYRFNGENKELAGLLEKQLRQELEETCCKCGCKYTTYQSEQSVNCNCITLETWAMYNKCKKCNTRELLENNRFKELIICKDNIDPYLLNEKIKIELPNGDILYVKLSKLTYKDSKFYLIEEPSMSSIPLTEIEPLGMYIGHRDITHERIYSGDILMFSVDNRDGIIPEAAPIYIDYAWNHVESVKDFFLQGQKYTGWVVDNYIDGFGLVPIHRLINPIVVASMSSHGFKARTITPAILDSIPSDIKANIISNIHRFESETKLRVITD